VAAIFFIFIFGLVLSDPDSAVGIAWWDRAVAYSA
jgi:hypothetical protein